MHGPIALVAAVRAAKQFLTYVSGAPFQPAIATALGLPDAFYADLAGDLARKRDLLVDGPAHRRVHRVPDARARTSSSPTWRRWASTTAPPSAGGCRS